MNSKSVMMDTCFFIRLLNGDDPLHQNALAYFQYFLNKGYCLRMSTIAVAEFCVRDTAENLPLRNLIIVPFNLNHAILAGNFISIVFKEKNKMEEHFSQRLIIPNDTKMFAQAECEGVEYYLTSDTESKKIYSILQGHRGLNYTFIDIHTPFSTFIGEFDFPDS